MTGMDVFVWGILGFGALICVLMIRRGFKRINHHVQVPRQSGVETQNTVSEPRDRVSQSTQEDHPDLQALRSKEPTDIVGAPLPEFFSEELLLNGLIEIQQQPSLYDRYLESITQKLTIQQYQRLVSQWKRYSDSLETGMGSYNAFSRQLSERLNMYLEVKRRQSSLEADIAEQELRAAQAHQRGPKAEPKASRPQFDSKEEEVAARHKQWQKADTVLADADLTENSKERRRTRAQYEADITEIEERWQRRQ